MIIFRYLAKEIFTTLCAVTGVLLLIFMSNQLVRYLARAVAGKLPASYIAHLMLLAVPQLVGLLLPLGLFFAIILAYGRLFAESEMTALMACGLSRSQLIRYTLSVAAIVAVFVGILSLWVGPKILLDREGLIRQGGTAIIFDALVPGRFQAIHHGKQVIYIQDINQDSEQLENVFAALDQTKKTARGKDSDWDIIYAKKGYLEDDKASQSRYFIVEDGHRYQGRPGHKDYKITEFARYALRLTERLPAASHNVKTMETHKLWPINNPNRFFAAELQWRLSIPLMTLILGLLAIPLSQVNPRVGKYARILPSTIIVIIYANLLFVVRSAIKSGSISPSVGVWWLHASFFLLSLLLIYATELKTILQRLRLWGD